VRFRQITLAGVVLLATAVACAHRKQPTFAARPFVAPPTTTPDSGENGLDPTWRFFCDVLTPSDGGILFRGARVACENHVVTLAPADGGAPRGWAVKPFWPEFDAFNEYMRACRLLDWDVGLEGVIDECRVTCINRELASVTTLDGGSCDYGESWMRELSDPRHRIGDFAPFGAPWD
jgi:hypothetical protein